MLVMLEFQTNRGDVCVLMDWEDKRVDHVLMDWLDKGWACNVLTFYTEDLLYYLSKINQW